MHWLEQVEQHISGKYGVIVFASLELDDSLLLQVKDSAFTRHEIEDMILEVRRFVPRWVKKIRIGTISKEG